MAAHALDYQWRERQVQPWGQGAEGTWSWFESNGDTVI